MARRIDTVCAECGRPIVLGDEYYCSDLTEDKLFCSENCMRNYILETGDYAEKVVTDWMEANAEVFEMEAEDPYDRYGVDRGDF